MGSRLPKMDVLVQDWWKHERNSVWAHSSLYVYYCNVFFFYLGTPPDSINPYKKDAPKPSVVFTFKSFLCAVCRNVVISLDKCSAMLTYPIIIWTHWPVFLLLAASISFMFHNSGAATSSTSVYKIICRLFIEQIKRSYVNIYSLLLHKSLISNIYKYT